MKCFLFLLFPLLLASTVFGSSIKLSFTNDTNKQYPDEKIFIWIRSAAPYNVKIEGNQENIRYGKSFSLASLKGKKLIVKNFVSGRIYISLGEPLNEAELNKDGTPKSDPGVHEGNNGYNVRHDFVEFTYTPADGDVADLTAMDQFGIPLFIQLKRNGNDISGPNVSAGWRGHNDIKMIEEIAKIASKPEDKQKGYIQYDDQGNFIRIRGATNFPYLYQNEPKNKRSMANYLKAIKAGQDDHQRKLTIHGTAFGKEYLYEAKLDNSGNYVISRINNDDTIPKKIVVPASYKAGPAKADPTITLDNAIFISNPVYSVDGKPLTPTQNDLPGSVVRDLFAALNLGYVNSTHKVAKGETIDDHLIGKEIHQIKTSDMQKLSVGFSQVNEFYNIYANAFRNLSDAYGYAYSDWNEHVGKVAVLPNMPRKEGKADEINIRITGNKIKKGKLDTPSSLEKDPANNEESSRSATYMDSIDNFLGD